MERYANLNIIFPLNLKYQVANFICMAQKEYQYDPYSQLNSTVKTYRETCTSEGMELTNVQGGAKLEWTDTY